jgi:hypothetical protein
MGGKARATKLSAKRRREIAPAAEKRGAADDRQAPLHNVDHFIKVQAFIPHSRSLQEICIEVRDAVIVATLKFLETRKAERRQRRYWNTLDNHKLSCLNLCLAEIQGRRLEFFEAIGRARLLRRQRLLNPI